MQVKHSLHRQGVRVDLIKLQYEKMERSVAVHTGGNRTPQTVVSTTASEFHKHNVQDKSQGQQLKGFSLFKSYVF